MAEIPKKLFREIENIAESDKWGDFKQEMMLGRVAKIHIANTFNGIVDMDFLDYGHFATFLHIQDTFSRFSAIIFTGAKKNKHRKWCEGR